ncbi:hypothetical protein D3C80_1959120 [compost metagenome]
MPLGQCRFDLVQGFHALERRIEHETRTGDRHRGAEQGFFGAAQAVIGARLGAEDLAKILMDGWRVVDDQDPPIGFIQWQAHGRAPF